VRGISCKFGEFMSDRCKDIERLQYQQFVGYNKIKIKIKKSWKIIKCIAIGLRNLSVRRPNKSCNL